MKIRIIKYATLATVLFILGFFSGNIYQLYKNYNYNLKIINYLQKEHKLLQHKNVSLKKLVSSFKKISLADSFILEVNESGKSPVKSFTAIAFKSRDET